MHNVVYNNRRLVSYTRLSGLIFAILAGAFLVAIMNNQQMIEIELALFIN